MDQHIGEQIRQVGGRRLFRYSDYSNSHRFPALVLAKTYVLIIQCKLRGLPVII